MRRLTTWVVGGLLASVTGAVLAQKTPNEYQAELSAQKAQREYDAQRAQRQALEAAQKSTAPQPITPDMCIDGVCVEQDLGAIASNLNWTPPAKPEEIPSSMRKSYEEGIRKGMETCEQSNKSQWGGNVRKLCDLLIFGNQRPRTELVSFFRDNKQPVCVAGGKSFNMGLVTPLGPTRFEVKFGKDGRPKVTEVTKKFDIPNKNDALELKAQIEKKHPYLNLRSDSWVTPPWGGYVRYLESGIGSHYELKARTGIFTNSRDEPNEGACAPKRQSISVQ